MFRKPSIEHRKKNELVKYLCIQANPTENQTLSSWMQRSFSVLACNRNEYLGKTCHRHNIPKKTIFFSGSCNSSSTASLRMMLLWDKYSCHLQNSILLLFEQQHPQRSTVLGSRRPLQISLG